MKVHFTRLRVGHPEPLRQPVDRPGSWRVYVICNGPSERLNTARDDIRACSSEADMLAMRTSFISFLAKAATGLPLEALWDEKQCHEAFSFKHEHHEHKIIRFWGAGKIRVYFVYLPSKVIVILKSKAKRSDKLTVGDETELKDIAKSVCNTLQETSFEERVI